MKNIRILLIEDNRLLREGITVLLKKQPDMHVVTTVGNGENILLTIGKHNPNIVLLDLGLRSQNSLKVVKSVKQNFQETKISVKDFIPLQADVFEFVEAGVSGFMLKNISVKEFLKIIRSIYKGTRVLTSHLTARFFPRLFSTQ